MEAPVDLVQRASERPLPRRLAAPPAVAPLGALAYLAYLAVATSGSLTAWSDSERMGWDSRFDYGRFTWTWLRVLLQVGGGPMDGFIVAGAVVAVLTAGWLLREGIAGVEQDRRPAAVGPHRRLVLRLRPRGVSLRDLSRRCRAPQWLA